MDYVISQQHLQLVLQMLNEMPHRLARAPIDILSALKPAEPVPQPVPADPADAAAAEMLAGR